ncbi:hypothetical protein EV183_003099 [Coemansia sp. RSA 2336]|nr:hypothetical protein EV183_003099 [Coemansia sp. RSA 2336]
MRYSQFVAQLLGLGALSYSGASADVAGTKTVIISLATGDQGEIIPVVLTSNSNGLIPADATASTEADSAEIEAPTSEWNDTSIEIVLPETDADASSDEDTESVIDDSVGESVDEDASEPADAEDASQADNDNAYESDSDSDREEEAHSASKDAKGSAKNTAQSLALTITMCIAAISASKF